MVGFLLVGDNVPFVAALVLMLLIGAAELAGLGSSLVSDADASADLSLLQWLNLGRLPLLMLLVVFLLSFGVLGLMGQRLVAALIGQPAPWFLAAPLALAAALPTTRAAGRLFARYLPTEETTAVDRDTLVGRMAVVVTGEAAAGSPAQARARDAHGQPHYVMVEPDAPEDVFAEGETVVLVRRAGATFFAIRGGPALQDARL
ncbi:OB-fold-containig protein [Phenylobacterium sp.]|uniref:OB-fold-containig protein n=1 Tax=Phenylobacterium sp. TaxID=1871053 RepID=UPI002EDB5F1E